MVGEINAFSYLVCYISKNVKFAVEQAKKTQRGIKVVAPFFL
jgi:hypothetical protein